MLVLTRRTDQSIVIGDPQKPEECIEVVAVDSTEIWEQKQQEKAAAPPAGA